MICKNCSLISYCPTIITWLQRDVRLPTVTYAEVVSRKKAALAPKDPTEKQHEYEEDSSHHTTEAKISSADHPVNSPGKNVMKAIHDEELKKDDQFVVRQVGNESSRNNQKRAKIPVTILEADEFEAAEDMTAAKKNMMETPKKKRGRPKKCGDYLDEPVELQAADEKTVSVVTPRNKQGLCIN